MKELRERFRERWAEVILNCAESLPTFNAGIVADLQETRKHQRKRSERDFEGSRLPQGTKIKLCGFTLLQLYPLEDLEIMEMSLRRWFPKTWADRCQELCGDVKSLTGVSWSYVGHVVQRRKPFFPGELAILDDLPSEIEHISIEVQKILPSLSVLAFGVTLAEDVSVQLLKLYNARYLGRIRFNHWFPFTLSRWGRAEEAPDRARERAIHSFVEDTRAKAERFITHHFPGPSHSSARRFVALDEFHVSHENSTPPEAGGAAAWDWQFGLGPWNYDRFRDDNVGSFLAAGKWSGLSYPHRLIVISDPQPGDEMKSRVENAIHELIPLLGIIAILADSEDSVGRLRLQVFKRMADRGVAAWFWRRISASFFREIRLNSALQIYRMLLARLRLEYLQHRDLFCRWCSGLKLFVSVHKADMNLLDSFQTAIIRQLDLVSEHLQLASDSFSAHVSARNIEVTYRLGRRVFFLTVVVTFATILGILGNWPTILCGLRSLLHMHLR